MVISLFVSLILFLTISISKSISNLTSYNDIVKSLNLKSIAFIFSIQWWNVLFYETSIQPIPSDAQFQIGGTEFDGFVPRGSDHDEQYAWIEAQFQFNCNSRHQKPSIRYNETETNELIKSKFHNISKIVRWLQTLLLFHD